MAKQFSSRVPHVAKDSAVSAGNIGSTTRALEARTNFLNDALKAIEEGRLLVHRDQPCESTIEVGQPVYWNSDNLRYELAYAAVETDAESGTLVPKASSDCIGLILSKTSAAVATVAAVGIAKFASLASAIDGDVLPGRYYLSAAEPGKLVRQRPPVTVAVCFVMGPLTSCDDDTAVFILPQMRDFIEDHVHYRFELTSLPAGTHTPPTAGECHEITDPDDSLPGWLPASHSSFNSTAPTGAQFGYNLAAHPELERVWPPVPLTAGVVFWDKGLNLVGATEVSTQGVNPLVVLDANGIWWMSCCEGEAPWPATYDNTSMASESVSSSSSSAGGDVCRTDRMRIILAFLHMVFANDKSVVTSLQPGTDQPIEFLNCDGEVATTGDLFARLILNAEVTDNNELGGLVLKRLINSNLEFAEGYVLEGLIAGSDNVELSGTVQRYLVPGDNSTPVVHQQIVTIDTNIDPSDRELSPQITKLGDAIERTYKDIMYLGLPQGRDSALRMRFDVPTVGLPPAALMKLRVIMFGRADGPWAEVTAGYYRIIRPTSGSPTTLTEGDTGLTFDVVTPSTGLSADDAIEVESSSFTVAAGDTVFIELARDSAALPVYDAEIGQIKAVGVIVAGP